MEEFYFNEATKSIDFKPSVHKVIKYKNGSTYYMLKKLEIVDVLNLGNGCTGHVYLKFTHGFHETRNYEYKFKRNQLFSDHFEVVNWSKIPIDARRKIVDEYDFCVDVDVDYLSRVKFNGYSASQMDSFVQQLGDKCGTHFSKEKAYPRDFLNQEVAYNNPNSNMIFHDPVSLASHANVITSPSDGTYYAVQDNGTLGISNLVNETIKKSYEEDIEPIIIHQKKNRKYNTISIEVDNAKILK